MEREGRQGKGCTERDGLRVDIVLRLLRTTDGGVLGLGKESGDGSLNEVT